MATTSAPATPFQPVIDLLNELSSEVAPAASDVHTAALTMDNVDQVLQRIKQLQTDFGNAISDMSDVRDLCAGLTDIPVVGEFAGTAADVLSEAINAATSVKSSLDEAIGSTVDPALVIVDPLHSDLNTLDSILSDIVDAAPVFTNTLAILEALNTIATSLAATLAGTTVGDNLGKLVATYSALRDDITTPINDLLLCVKAIASAVDALNPALSKTQSFGSAVSNASSAISGVSSILDPIRSAMSQVESAIAPVRWALDAASCIFDEIVEPVLDSLEDDLGLSSLVNGLAGPLNSALAISNFVNSITSNIDAGALSQGKSSLDQQQAPATSGWANLQGPMAQYDCGPDGPQESAVEQLVDAITGASPGSGLPPITRWPPPRPIYTPPTQVSVPSRQQTVLVRIQSGLKGMAVPSKPPSLLLAVAAVPANPPPLGPHWTAVTTLGAEASAVVAVLNGLQADLATLSSQSNSFNSSQGLGFALGNLLSDVLIDLKTAADTVAFLQLLPGIGDVLGPLGTSLGDQVAACTSSQAAVTQLSTNLASMESVIPSAISSAPSSNTVAQAIGCIGGWGTGAQALARAIDLGRKAKQTPTSGTELDQRQAQLIAQCAVLQGQIQAISNSTTEIRTDVGAVIKQLGDCASALLAVAQHGVAISSQGQTNANEVAHLLSVVDSLISPLTLLMKQLNCAAPEATAGANTAVQSLITVSKSGAANSSTRVKYLLDTVFSLTLPLGPITTEASNANQVVNSSTSELTSAASRLAAGLATLTKNLSNAQTYSLPTSSGATVTVPNQYLDNGTAVAVVNLAKALSVQPI